MFTRFASFCFTGAKVMFIVVCKYVSVVVLFLHDSLIDTCFLLLLCLPVIHYLLQHDLLFLLSTWIASLSVHMLTVCLLNFAHFTNKTRQDKTRTHRPAHPDAAGLQYWSASRTNIYEDRKTCIFCVLSLVKPTSVLKLSWNFLNIWSWNFTSCCWEPCMSQWYHSILPSASSVPFSVFCIYYEYIYEIVDHFCLGFFLGTDGANRSVDVASSSTAPAKQKLRV